MCQLLKVDQVMKQPPRSFFKVNFSQTSALMIMILKINKSLAFEMSDYTTSVAFRAVGARPSIAFFKERPPKNLFFFVREPENRDQMQAWVTPANSGTQGQTIT